MLLLLMLSAFAGVAQAHHWPTMPISDGVDVDEIMPGVQRPCSGDPVSCKTGNFYEAQTDLAIGGVGVGLVLERTYNARLAGSAGRFGYGWSMSFGERVVVTDGGERVTIHHADGLAVEFTRYYDDTVGDWTPLGAVTAVHSRLVEQGDGSWVYTLPDRRVYRFAANGRLVSKADRNDNRTTVAYDGAGRPVSITDPAGRSIVLSYNAADTVQSAAGPGGRVVRYGYDARGDLTSVTDVGGAVWRFVYDAAHRIVEMTDPRGAKTTNVYDASGRVVRQTDPRGNVMTWSYVASPAQTRVTDALGLVTTYSLGGGLLTGVAREGAATLGFSNDGQANVASVTDPNGRTWGYGYDGSGNRTRVNDPQGRSTTFSYTGARDVQQVVLPSGRSISYTYDARGNVTEVSRQLNGAAVRQRFAYDARGLLTSSTDPLSSVTRFEYNAQGDRTATVSPEGRRTTATYDVNGWLASTTTPRGNRTTYNRDVYGRVLSVTDPLGRSTQNAYDAVGNLVSTTDRDGRRTQFAYDLAGNRTTVTRGTGAVERYAYDARGALISVTNGLGNVVRFTRDDRGRVSAMTDPLGRVTSYGYDAAGNKTRVTAPDGTVTTMQYDTAHQLRSTSYSNANPGAVSFDYDVDGRLTSMTDSTGTSTRAYDALDRLVSSSNGRGQTATYGYDLADRLTSVRYPTALTPKNMLTGAGEQSVATGTVTREYDRDGLMTRVTDWLGHRWPFWYDEDGLLRERQHADYNWGVAKRDANGRSTEYRDWSEYGEWVEDGSGFWTYQRTILSVLLDNRFTRSFAGLLTSDTDSVTSGASQQFGYDADARLTAAGPSGSRSYAYNAGDDPTRLHPSSGAVTQAFDAANGLTRVSRASDGALLRTVSSDANGRRRQVTPPTGASTTYTYDGADQLVSYSGPRWDGRTSTVLATYTYDGTGLRQTKTIDDLNTTAARTVARTTQTFHHADGLPVLLTDGPDAYITGPGGMPLAKIAQGGQTTYIHTDDQGSVRALTNQAAEAQERYDYDPYGTPTTSSAKPGVTTPFGYDGQITDAESGLQYLRARHYDPSTAQFLTRDPIDLLGPYIYANNNPLAFHDPSGLLFGVKLPSLTDVGNFVAGAADGATFSAASAGLGLIGVEVDKCSAAYQAGGWVPVPSPLSVVGKVTKVAKAVQGANGATRTIPKPPRGPGAVPKADRDPKRLYTRPQVRKGLEDQGGVCATCRNPIDDLADARGHHVDRHADGAPTIPENLAVLCPECHKAIHRK